MFRFCCGGVYQLRDLDGLNKLPDEALPENILEFELRGHEFLLRPLPKTDWQDRTWLSVQPRAVI